MKRILFFLILFFLSLHLFSQELSDWTGDQEGAQENTEASQFHTQPITIEGFLRTVLQYQYLIKPFPQNITNSHADLKLTVNYQGSITYASFSFYATTEYLTNKDPKGILYNLFDEAYVQVSFANAVIIFGYYKPIWLTGDDLNVVDVFLPYDWSSAVTRTYLEKRKAQLLINASVYLGTRSMLELFYLPLFNPDVIPDEENIWAFPFSKDLAKVKQRFSRVAINNSYQHSITDSQLGLRFSMTLSNIDFSFFYAYTRLRFPRLEDRNDSLYFLYDPVHIFGVFFNALAGPFVFWGAGSYYLTYDTQGTDPQQIDNHIRYNGKIEWTVPLSHLVLAVEIKGIQFFHLQTHFSYSGYAVTSFYDNRTNLIMRLSDTYFNRALTPAVEAGVSLLNFDWYMAALVDLILPENLSLSIRTVFYEGESGHYGFFAKNDFFSLSLRYEF